VYQVSRFSDGTGVVFYTGADQTAFTDPVNNVGRTYTYYVLA